MLCRTPGSVVFGACGLALELPGSAALALLLFGTANRRVVFAKSQALLIVARHDESTSHRRLNVIR